MNEVDARGLSCPEPVLPYSAGVKTDPAYTAEGAGQ